nr:alpha-2,8-polysialyltransferase family protein [Bradyrhizobium liaoningense]
MGITAYHRFAFALLSRQLDTRENVLLEVTWPGQERPPSRYDKFFTERISLPIEKHFFRKPAQRAAIDARLREIVSKYDVSEVLVAQDLDARMQYCATFFSRPISVVEDGMSSYVQTADPWRVVQRLITYKLFLGRRYLNFLGMGLLPAVNCFAFNPVTGFPKVADRNKIKPIAIPAGDGLQDHAHLDRSLIVVTQPLAEDDLATEDAEIEVFEALGRAAAALDMKLLLRSHPRESLKLIEKRIDAMRRGGARLDTTTLKDFEVIEEAFATGRNPPVFGFSSTALSNARRINPRLKVLSAVRWLSRVPPRELEVYVNALASAGVTILQDLSELEEALKSLHDED